MIYYETRHTDISLLLYISTGEKIARMICLCSYHRHCLAEWLERGKGCPVHYDPAL